MCPKILLSSFAAITIALAGVVSADKAAIDNPNITGEGNQPFSAANPVPNAEAQAKTEKMLKEEAAEISGEGNQPFSAANPVPNAEAQAKTEKMLKGEQKVLQGN